MSIARKGKAALKASVSPAVIVAKDAKAKPKALKGSARAKVTQALTIISTGKIRLYQYTMTQGKGVFETHKHTFDQLLALTAEASIQGQSMMRVLEGVFAAEYGPEWAIVYKEKRDTKLGKRISDRLEQFRAITKQKAIDARKDIESGDKKRPAALAAVAVKRLVDTGAKNYRKAFGKPEPRHQETWQASAKKQASRIYTDYLKTAHDKLTARDIEIAKWLAAGLKVYFGVSTEALKRSQK